MNKRSGAVGAATMILIALGLAAPAWALDVRWFTRDVNYFAGLRCGDTDQVAVTLKANAFDVSILRPAVGAKLTDDATGRTDATITSIHRTGSRIVFTATASDDVCSHPDSYADNGWETKAVHFDVNYRTHEHSLYPSACNDPAYRPHGIIVACHTGNFNLDHIRWSTWNDTGARGIGTAHVNDCTRSCGKGHFRSYPGVVVQLDRSRYCSANRDFEFTRLRYRYTRTRPPGAAVAGSVVSGCAARSAARDR